MPVEVVSVRARAPALAENAFFNYVLDRTDRDTGGIVRWSERMKEVGGGRRPTKRRRRTVKERQGYTDEQTKYPSISANAES